MNELLHSFGLPSVIPLDFQGLETEKAVNAVTFFLALLRQHEVFDVPSFIFLTLRDSLLLIFGVFAGLQTDVQIRNDFEEKNSRLASKVDTLQGKVELLESQKLDAERDAYSARFKGE